MRWRVINSCRSAPTPQFHNVQLLHERLHRVFSRMNQAGYQSCTHCMAGHSEHKVPLIIMMSMQIAPLAQALAQGLPVPRPDTTGKGCGSQHETQQCMHAASAERLHHQRTRRPQPCWPSKSPNICAQGGILSRACSRAYVHVLPQLMVRSMQEEHDIGHINRDQSVRTNCVLIAHGM